MKSKERPILFSGEMVRAILDGSKTQTRRIVKGFPLETINFMAGRCDDEESKTEDLKWWWDGDNLKFSSAEYPEEGWVPVVCPYGQPGDRLWVRETWMPGDLTHKFYYRASHPEMDGYYKWKPSIHMPRKACRLTLGITNVKVECLNDISEEDAQVEGVPFDGTYWLGGTHPVKGSEQCWATAKQAFEKRFDAIYPGSWEKNPWVWVVSFRRLNANH